MLPPPRRGAPITVDEIDTLGKRIEWVRTVVATDRASQGNAPDVTADIAALGAATHEEDVSECINVALGGKVRELPEMLSQAAAVGVAEIRIIRALGIRAMQLARLRAEVDAGAELTERPRRAGVGGVGNGTVTEVDAEPERLGRMRGPG